MTDTLDIAHNIDEAACLDILSDMVRHKSYSETPGERALAESCNGDARYEPRGRIRRCQW